MIMETPESHAREPAEPQHQNRFLLRQISRPERWESYRDEIYQIYVLQKNTLQATMKVLKEKHNFTPSERAFKEKIKEWKFEKYLSTEEATFIAMKAKAREKQGKDTTFYKHGVKINQKRLAKSAKRKREVFEELEDFTPPTPDQITYSTPAPPEDIDNMSLFKGENTRQMICDPASQKVDSFPDLPPATRSSSPFWTPFSNDNPDALAQMNSKEQSFTQPTLDVADPPYPLTLKMGPHLSKTLNKSDQYQSDSFYEMGDGTESDKEHEMKHFISLEKVDYLEYVAFKHHLSNEKSITKNAIQCPKSPPSLFHANDEIRGEAENPKTNQVPDEETESAAWAYKQAGNMAEASAVYLRLINRYTHTYGSQSALTLEKISRLAELYQDQGLLLLSIDAYQKVVDGYQTIYGESALETLQALHNLATAMEENSDQSDLQQAESLYRRAIAGFERLGGVGLAPRLNSQQFLGDFLCDAKRYKEAKPLLVAAVGGYATLGFFHLEIVALGSL